VGGLGNKKKEYGLTGIARNIVFARALGGKKKKKKEGTQGPGTEEDTLIGNKSGREKKEGEVTPGEGYRKKGNISRKVGGKNVEMKLRLGGKKKAELSPKRTGKGRRY